MLLHHLSLQVAPRPGVFAHRRVNFCPYDTRLARCGQSTVPTLHPIRMSLNCREVDIRLGPRPPMFIFGSTMPQGFLQ